MRPRLAALSAGADAPPDTARPAAAAAPRLIALHVGGGKNPQQCFEHYMLCYALARVDDARGFALPAPPTEASRRALAQEHSLVGPRVFETIDPATLGTVACRMEQLSFARNGGGAGPPSQAASAPPGTGEGPGAALSRPGDRESGGGGGGGGAKIMSHDVAGYMPLRDDFDIEYDNDAEELISDMEFRAVRALPHTRPCPTSRPSGARTTRPGRGT